MIFTLLADLPAGGDLPAIDHLAVLMHPDLIVHIDRRADVVRDDVHALSDPRPATVARELHVTVLLVHLGEERIGILDHVAVAGASDPAIAAEGLGAAVDDHLTRDRGADHGGGDARGAVAPTELSEVNCIAVVEDVRSTAV